nr:MAG TPA: hypothetical protein [Caudoviricetes sp.]
MLYLYCCIINNISTFYDNLTNNLLVLLLRIVYIFLKFNIFNSFFYVVFDFFYRIICYSI